MAEQVNFDKNFEIFDFDTGLPVTEIDQVGDEIHYSFVIEAQHTVPGDFLDGFLLTDALLGLTNFDVIAAISSGALIVDGDDGDNVLEVGETWTITEGDGTVDLSYSVTQEDLDSNATLEPANLLPGKIDNDALLWGFKGDILETISDESTSAPIRLIAGIDIEKSTNDEDADEPTGPYVRLGDPVTWDYTVTNTGNVALDISDVIDDNGTAGDTSDDFTPTYVGGDTDGDGLLDVDEIWAYTALGSAEEGQYGNIASVSGVAPDGSGASDEDPSHYFGVDSSIDIEKATNGQDADDGTGPVVAAGSAITWTYVVTNTGNVALTDIVVKDDNGTAGDTSDDIVIGTIDLLLTDETMTLTYESTAAVGQYTNVGCVIAADELGDFVEDCDPSNHFGSDPDIDIVKSGAFNDENGDGYAQPGETITYAYTVTSGGSNVPILNVMVIDDAGTPADPSDDFMPTFTDGDINGNGALDLNETWSYTATVAIDQDDINAGGITNIACVTGEDAIGQTVEDCDPETVELTPPPMDFAGNTPGFWKNHSEIFEAVTGLNSHETGFAETFGITTGDCFEFAEGKSLQDALEAKGGGLNALARHSTAALANSESPISSYGYAGYEGALDDVIDTIILIDLNGDGVLSTDEVINAVQDVCDQPTALSDYFGEGHVEDVKDAFDYMNNVLPEIEKGDLWTYFEDGMVIA